MYNMEISGKRHIQLAGTATVGPKGQVVIPADVRTRMGIAPGDKLVVLFIPEKNSVGFVAESRVQQLIEKMGNSIDELKSAIDS
mgnify:CR=1 FL=1